MGLGIGKTCERCGDYLNHEKGFNDEENLCNRCEHILRFDAKQTFKQFQDQLDGKGSFFLVNDDYVQDK